MYRRLILFLLSLLTTTGFCQVPEGFPLITKNDLPDASFSDVRTFTGTSLFGYINGGAELYLEYGFSAATVTEISLIGGKYKTEIYKMSDPEAAFGIFSVSKYCCLGMPPLSDFTCHTRYQLQICMGHYYVSIINGTGTRSDSIASLRIGTIIADKIKETDVDLTRFLPGVPPEAIQINSFLARGRLGIVNGSPDLEDYFKEVTGFTAVILKGHDKTTLSIRMHDAGSYKDFIELHNWNQRDITSDGFITSAGELVKSLYDNHLYIEILK